MTISAGLVGFGLAGRQLHTPLLLAAGMEIVGVVTQRAELVRQTLPQARTLESLEALLTLRPLDLVVIATPNHLHAPQGLACLAAGKHVVIDKPLALSLAEADALMAAAQRHQRTLAVFHNRRWDADFLTLQKLLSQGVLGTLYGYEARWDRYRPQPAQRWRERAEAGGGVLLDLGSHLIDQALCLFGTPQWLQADVFTQRAGALVDDGFEIRMGFGALRIELGTSSIAAEHALRYRLHGSSGSFLKAGMDPQETQLRQGLSPLDAAFGVEEAAHAGRFVAAQGGEPRSEPSVRGDWLAFYRAMRQSIESGAPPPVTAAEARRVLQIIDAARRSSELGRRISL